MSGLLHTCTDNVMAVAPVTYTVYCLMCRLLSSWLSYIIYKEIMNFIHICNPSQFPRFAILLPLIPLQLSENKRLTKAESQTTNWQINRSTKQNYRNRHKAEPETLYIHLSNAQLRLLQVVKLQKQTTVSDFKDEGYKLRITTQLETHRKHSVGFEGLKEAGQKSYICRMCRR